MVPAVRTAEAAGVILVPNKEIPEYTARFAQAKSFSGRGGLRPGKPSGGQPNNSQRNAGAPVLMLRDSAAAEGLVGSKASFTTEQTTVEKESHNIVGVLRGTDPKLSQEYVIHSAHYDHEGIQGGKILPRRRRQRLGHLLRPRDRQSLQIHRRPPPLDHLFVGVGRGEGALGLGALRQQSVRST